MVALSIVGSAILLYSCNDSGGDGAGATNEGMMTEYSENLSIIESKNGRRSFFFETPLLEGYNLGREPYREFRKGIKIITYQDDSLTKVDAVLTANYAINYEKRELWEAKGNVVVEKSDGKTLYTQQLFWNQRTKMIYSNVDSKIVQSGGRDVFIGEGFESDEAFKDWRFRRMKGRMEVEVSPTEQADSTAAPSPARSDEPRPAKPDVQPAAPKAAAGQPQTTPPARREQTDALMPMEAASPAQNKMKDEAIPAAGLRLDDSQLKTE